MRYASYFAAFIHPESLDLDAQNSLGVFSPGYHLSVCVPTVSVPFVTGRRLLPGCISVCMLSSNLQTVRQRVGAPFEERLLNNAGG